MKRVKESYNKNFFGYDHHAGVSGCKDFQGEDLDYDARIKINKEQQREWIQQKIKENQEKVAQEKEEERQYAEQVKEMNRMRGMLEDNFLEKKHQMRLDMKEQNLRLLQERKNLEEEQKNKRLNHEQLEASGAFERGIKTQFTGFQSPSKAKTDDDC